MNSEKKETIFDRIVSELMQEDTGADLIDSCMKLKGKIARNAPLRYRIIALGFIRGYDLAQVNEALIKEGYAQLYARNLLEASLIYAFTSGYDYKQWKELSRECLKIRAEMSDQDFDPARLSYNSIAEYVKENSDQDRFRARTRHRTMFLAQDIIRTSQENRKFTDYVKANLSSFSMAREKSRYYFIKYLMYYLDRRIEECSRAYKKGNLKKVEMSSLTVFRGTGDIRQGKIRSDKVEEVLKEAAVSPGSLFSDFNDFYFGYVSLDWMDVLLEYFGNLDRLPAEYREKLTQAAKHYYPQTRRMTEEETIDFLRQQEEKKEYMEDEAYSLSGSSKGYQKNRVGENVFRKYLKGDLDIDRTTLVCMLIFLGNDLENVSEEDRITETRLNRILRECGFRPLDKRNAFDAFIIEFLSSEDPVDYMMEEVTRYAIENNNFYFYKVYQASRSESADLEKILAQE